jgi:hypothetical protein
MTEGIFRTQINIAWDILKHLELDAERVPLPNYPKRAASIFRHLSYLETWRLCFRQQYYDFQLSDSSLLQFEVDSYAPLTLRYAYYECPYESLTYAEFLEAHGFSRHDVGDELTPDYEDYLSTCEMKETVTPIRYDYSPELYMEGIHPASHIHFGHRNNVRVATENILRPLSFLCLILRQCYPEAWRQLLTMQEAEIWSKNVRENLDGVDDNFWNPLDEWEMRLQ